MRKLRSLVLLLPLLGVMGTSHCEEGDRLAFSGGRSVVPLVAATRGSSSLTGEGRVSFIAYSNGVVQISTDIGGEGRSRSVWIPSISPAVFELHQDVIAVGGGDLVGTLEDCGVITSFTTSTIITVAEPWRSPGRAWTTTFSFATCPIDSRAPAVWEVIEAFVDTHFPGGFGG